MAANNNKEYDVEDVVVMSFKTDKGVLGTANFNSLALDKKDEMIIYGKFINNRKTFKCLYCKRSVRDI